MATWLSGSGISGIGPDGYGIPNAAQWVPGTVGTVDVNLPTRIQYVKAGELLSGLVVTAKIRYTKSELEGLLPGRRHSATMYLLPASMSDKWGWTLPTTSQIVAASRGRNRITRSLAFAPLTTSAATVDVTYTFPTIAANRLNPGEKYWLAISPTVVWEADTNPDYDTTSAPLMKALSFWTNRAPLAPVITQPIPGSSVAEGESFLLSAVPGAGDPDVIWPAVSYRHRDWAGVQVQYAAMPTRTEPNPSWVDLPFATSDPDDPDPGYSFAGVTDSGLGWLRLLGTTEIKGGSSVTSPGAGILPSGSWQIRMRTFDFGHPLSNMDNPGPDGAVLTPATYPSINTSPWSTPVPVTVTARVPAPIPIAPTSGSAVQDGTLISLAWRYRNTATPPSPQKSRTVQMRRVGDPNWVTLVSGNSTGQTHAVQQMGSPVAYITDGTFESGNLGEWYAATTTGAWGDWGTDSSAVASVQPHPVYSGQKRLRLTGMSVTNSGVVRDVWLMGHSVLTLSGTVQAGPAQNGRAATVQVSWFNSSDVLVRVDHVGTTNSYDAETFGTTLQPPATAIKLSVQIFATTPVSGNSFTIDDFTLMGADPAPSPVPLVPGYQYEWRVKVTDATDVTSDYSQPSRFWIVPAPAGTGSPELPDDSIEGGSLGCGNNRAFLYRRGGEQRLGEITSLASIDWGRQRDDISDAKIVVSAEGVVECEPLLKELLPWAHEIVIFREIGNGVSDRVWEGPVTLVTHETNSVTIHAKDVIAYLYRRIIRLLMSDARFGDTVVNRAMRVIQHALSVDDPNVLQYLTPLTKSDDARQYRSTPPYSRTAFEEVDDMAANSGLDYAAVGRAILLWGTKHRIGTLPEFRDGDLGSPPIVSMYGMSMANRYVVSDGNGVWGAAEAEGAFNEDGVDPIYGLIEMLSSSWASDSTVDPASMTAENIAKTIKSFEGFAERSVADKYPVPVVVRVPDNTALSPQAPVSIQHLVPGVVIPLRSTGTLHHVVANQKLDSIRVSQVEGTETITITMSPFSRDDAATEGVEVE